MILCKCCIWYASKFENSAVAIGLEKVSFHSNPKDRQFQRMLKLPHNCIHFSHASKAMFKILQAKLQQYVNCELLDVEAGFRKDRGARDKIANICWIIKKQNSSRKKHLLQLYWLCQSLWLCGSQQTVENSSRDGNTRPSDLPPEKSVWRSGSNS